MDINTLKKELRKQMLQKRRTFPMSEKVKYDSWICGELQKIVKKESSKVVHVYLPMGNEIEITPFLEFCLSKQITVVSPKTLPKRRLKNLILNAIEDVEDGVYGTTHPANTKEYLGNYDLIIVPGLAFDAENFRLGYGGGYYDNFLLNHPEANKVGIFYPFQEVDTVPTETHDVSLNLVLTNTDLIK